MIVVTATLLFLTLIFAPIHLRVNVSLYGERGVAQICVGIGALKIFDERISLSDGSLHCAGTVETDVRLNAIDRKSGIDLFKCITIEKVYISIFKNLASLSATFAVQNALVAVATATACNLFHCRIFTEFLGTVSEDCVRLRALINFSVAELSFCLLTQGVRKWKTRKSEK